MFSDVETALSRLYPSRTWGELDLKTGGGLGADRVQSFCESLSRGAQRACYLRLGGHEDWSDVVDVQCIGRQPGLAALLGSDAGPVDEVRRECADTGGIQELYLRVVFSALAPLATTMEVRLTLTCEASGWWLHEDRRAGVFDPLLLSPYRKVVEVLSSNLIRNVDFGDLASVPTGYDGSAFKARYGTAAWTANYLFFPEPCNTSNSWRIT